MRTQIHLIKSKGLFYLTSLGLLAAMVLGLFTPGIALAQPQSPTSLTDSYIIVFKDDVNPRVEVPSVAKTYGLQTGFIYEHALKGMSAVVPAGRLAALEKDPRVAYVVADMERSISAQTVPTGIQRIFADTNTAIGIDGTDDYRVDVDVAVIDTGIDLQHPELNVVDGVTCASSTPVRPAVCKAGGDDDHYHGTHVAGTIAAIDNGSGVVGVAPGARLWAVKVCDSRGSCPSSAIIAGIDYVTANAGEIEVANMSLGGSGYSTAEYNAIQGAVNKGVAFAVAAGNNDADARNYSPAAFDNVLTVSALADFDGKPGGLGSPTCRTDQDDTLADFSNWGPAVDIAAPGVCILSTYPIEKGSYGTISGTSMASPHAAGALALLASVNKPTKATEVYALYKQVKDAGNLDWVDDSGDGIKEPLLDVSKFKPTLIPTGGTTNNPPSANFSFTTNELTVTFTDTSTDSDGTISAWNWNFGDESTSTAQNPSHTYSAAGTYNVTLTVTDDEGATGTVSKSVTVNSQSTSTITVANLAGVPTTINKNFWKATVTITVDPALSGAVVSGSWGTGGTGTCTTDGAGQCAISSPNLRTNVNSTTFIVSGVVLAGYDYVPGVTSVTVNKP
ncbi:MAG: S8 family serine peptidase [Brevefilum sp.]|nr:S8 family serine peptidase [Brevefilum sp.]